MTTPDIAEARRLANRIHCGDDACGCGVNLAAALIERQADELKRLRHWPEIANERAAEICRLNEELERLRAQVAQVLKTADTYGASVELFDAVGLLRAAPAQQAEPVATGDVWLKHDDDLRFVARVLSGGLQAPEADIKAAREIVHGLRTTARAHAAPSLRLWMDSAPRSRTSLTT